MKKIKTVVCIKTSLIAEYLSLHPTSSYTAYRLQSIPHLGNVITFCFLFFILVLILSMDQISQEAVAWEK